MCKQNLRIHSYNYVRVILILLSLSMIIIAGMISSSTHFDEVSANSFDPPNFSIITIDVNNESQRPSIAIDSFDNIYVVYVDYMYMGPSLPEHFSLNYNFWNTTSNIWEGVVPLSSNTNGIYNPEIVIDKLDNVHIVWQDFSNLNGSGSDGDIFYKYWNASSLIWSNTEVVSTESTDRSLSPTVAYDSANNIHVIWSDTTNYQNSGTDYDLFYKQLDVSTQIWTTTEVIVNGTSNYRQIPDITIDRGDNIHIVWEDITDYYNSSGADSDIFYKMWNELDQSWTNIFLITEESSYASTNPNIVTDKANNLHLVWEDKTNFDGIGNEIDIIYKLMNSTTMSWGSPQVVSESYLSTSLSPSIAVDNGYVYVVWSDNYDLFDGSVDFDIFYRKWLPTTKSWDALFPISTESTSGSSFPDLAVDSQYNLHVVWEDVTPYLGAENRNIFYKTNKGMTTTVTQTQTDTITESNYDTITAIDTTITNIEKTTQTEYEYSTVVEKSTEIKTSTTEIFNTKSEVKWSNFFILPLLFFQLARRKRK